MKTAIQLFAVRDAFDKDPISCLKELKKMGYDGVELCGWGGKNEYWLRGVCDAIGLEIPSIHISIWGMSEFPHEFAEKARALGLKYAVVPYLGDDQFPGGASFDMVKGEFLKVGKELAPYGIKILYHNHGGEFAEENKVNGDYRYDALMNSFLPEELGAEIDTCWAHNMGVDPAKHILRYAGRIPAVHLKDYITKGRGKKAVWSTCPFGDGNVNAKEVIESALKAGSEWLIVEEDNPYPSGKTELDCAAKSLKNIKKLLKEVQN